MSGIRGRVFRFDLLKSSGVTRVFVYGTLRSGGVAEGLIGGVRRPAELADHALYGRTHPYPFAVPRTGSVVYGEIADIVPDLLDELDEYEGDEYVRVERTVHTDRGNVVAQVWLAVADPPLPESELITSGDWFDR